MIGVREKQKQIYTCNLVYWDKYFTESNYISQKNVCLHSCCVITKYFVVHTKRYKIVKTKISYVKGAC